MAFLGIAHAHGRELTGAPATSVVAAMVAVVFAGSTLVTPLYVIYERQLGFSRITLTLIYAAYVVGNLAALLFCGGWSDRIGRRQTALPAITVAIVSALVFLFDGNVAALYVGRILSGLGIGLAAGTGTAWLAELIGQEDKTRASALATSANFLGLGVGALVSGLLAQYTQWPLQLPFIVYLLALLAVAALTWRTKETIAHAASRLRELPLRPQLSVPSGIRGRFVAPAITGFGAMALVGFYAALEPSIAAENLHQGSHAVAGALFAELAFVCAATIVLTQRLTSRLAMLAGLVLMVPSVILVVSAQVLASMPIMIAATATCALATGLGYRGSLQVVNQIAPGDQRAEVVSSYFVCGFCGNALPVIGVGILSTLISAAAASMAFAAVIICFAAVALSFGFKYAR